ncbi:hypothetical protein [Dysgonomonas sp. 25]|uniref:hypothetical protein n=1 Tax=Dysgonomonas sp. 25 TaxID=2302933 RepID=UPI0013D41B1C|nr:hypothetical protein [Dysgonomonas sp. 25]NDV70304.1 hypothetical protein [Dysgonomonas sp. 25]
MKTHTLFLIAAIILCLTCLLHSCNSKAKSNPDQTVPAQAQSNNSGEPNIPYRPESQMDEEEEETTEDGSWNREYDDIDWEVYYIEEAPEQEEKKYLSVEFPWDVSFLAEAQETAIEDPVVIDSLNNMMEYVWNTHGNWDTGDFYFLDDVLPSHIKPIVFRRHDSDEYENYTYRVLDLEKRQKVLIYYPDFSTGYVAYNKIVEYLSLNRFSINFYSLYTNNRTLARTLLPKQVYDEKYQHLVNCLLVAYNDFQQQESLLEEVASAMARHEYLMGHPDYEGNQWIPQEIGQLIRKQLPESSIEAMKKDDEEANVMWIYSFWVRRDREDKTEEIYNLLSAIKADYEGATTTEE